MVMGEIIEWFAGTLSTPFKFLLVHYFDLTASPCRTRDISVSLSCSLCVFSANVVQGWNPSGARFSIFSLIITGVNTVCFLLTFSSLAQAEVTLLNSFLKPFQCREAHYSPVVVHISNKRHTWVHCSNNVKMKRHHFYHAYFFGYCYCVNRHITSPRTLTL